jgi:predicted nucleic acid-binding protein
MDCIVDTNVISDVATRDPVWFTWSIEQISDRQKQLIINPIIYSELCCHARSPDEIETLIGELALSYREIPRESLFLAAKAFLVYRRRGGTKSAPLPDFFIGAHAEVLQLPIITRDVSRYRSYFPSVRLIAPEEV